LNVLFLMLEFRNWQQARSLAYPSQLGLVEALRATGATVLTLPVVYGIAPDAPGSWLRHAQRLVAGMQFDQVWIEVVHSSLDAETLAWLTRLAPIRVGFILESLQYSPAVYAHAPHLQGRKELVWDRLRSLTHAVAADEVDADEIEHSGAVRGLWWPQAVPAQFLQPPAAAPAGNGLAVFYGALYGDRAHWFAHPQLKDLLQTPQPSLEHATAYPRHFDELMQAGILHLEQGENPTRETLNEYLVILRHIRQEIFRLWLQSLQSGCAVVNLPSFFNGYPGRVFEAMAAGRPVITPRLLDRPRTASLFTEGEEILLFDSANPEDLAACIRRVQAHPQWAQELAERALHKVRTKHTLEHRVQEILTWTIDDVAPQYGKESPCFAA
jgi:hypothetical protein